jgi:hypothetical protein
MSIKLTAECSTIELPGNGASPAQKKALITILGDSIDMAGDATDGRFLSQRPEAGEQYTTGR